MSAWVSGVGTARGFLRELRVLGVAFAWLAISWAGSLAAATNAMGPDAFSTGGFSWRASPPIRLAAPEGPGTVVAIKDPSFVRHEGRWHLFATVRRSEGPVGMAWWSFSDWSDAEAAVPVDLALHRQYHCAPQVFFFAPQQRWYLVYQLADTNRIPAFGPHFSTTTRITDPRSWTRPAPMITSVHGEPKWLDFWVICDESRAHLFYTSLDGRMWRRDTPKARFPLGWSEPEVALEADIFEASHTYKLKGTSGYLTLVEAQGDGRRYYKAYAADRPEGPWRGWADSFQRPFASVGNVAQTEPWTANISHGELLRAGVDELMEVEPVPWQFLFEGAWRWPEPWRITKGLDQLRRWRRSGTPQESEAVPQPEPAPLASPGRSATWQHCAAAPAARP